MVITYRINTFKHLFGYSVDESVWTETTLKLFPLQQQDALQSIQAGYK